MKLTDDRIAEWATGRPNNPITSEINDLIRRSSVGAGLDDIKARGIDAHLADLEREMHPRGQR
jgi:hypothetical protein